MSLGNQSVAHLRSIILDEDASASRRLQSIDILASQSNAWQTRKVYTDATCETPKRMKHFLRKALRLLIKSAKFKAPAHNSAIRARLLFMSGTAVGTHLYRNKTGTAPATSKPATVQSATLSGIAAVLAEFEKQRAGEKQL
jgi:hypothetical protein